MLYFLEKYETKTPSIWEIVKILLHGLNIIRYIPNYSVKAWIWALKV